MKYKQLGCEMGFSQPEIQIHLDLSCVVAEVNSRTCSS